MGLLQQFLRVDYSLSCTEDRYLSFQLVPILMLVIFTAGFPVVIFLLLFINRKRLQTPSVRAQLGFLYAPFRPNAGEFWEVHELLRKLMLMGALVLIETTKVRMIVALLVCVVSVMSLNYLRPHKNGVVLLVAQASFLLTTFKYILAIALDDVAEAERETLGLVLIFLDVCFVLGSVVSLFAVFYLVGLHVQKEIVVEPDKGDEKVLASSSMTKVMPRSKKSLSIMQVRQAVVDEKVRIFETEHAKHHAKALDLIQVRKLNAAARVQSRLKKRKNKKEGDSGKSVSSKKKDDDENITAEDMQSLNLPKMQQRQERPRPSEKSLAMIEKVRLLIKGKIGSLKRLHNVFAKLDVDHNGMMSKGEFEKLVNAILKKKSIDEKTLGLFWEAAWEQRKHGAEDEIDAPTLGQWLCLD